MKLDLEPLARWASCLSWRYWVAAALVFWVTALLTASHLNASQPLKPVWTNTSGESGNWKDNSKAVATAHTVSRADWRAASKPLRRDEIGVMP